MERNRFFAVLFVLPLLASGVLADVSAAGANATDAAAVSELDRAVDQLATGGRTREQVRSILVQRYQEGRLRRDDIRRVVGEAYERGVLTRDDVKWLLVQAYRAGELTRDDVREVITWAYRKKQLSRDDLRWLIISSYKAGELSREDVKELLFAAYRERVLTRDDIWELLGASFQAGELTREDVKWLLVQAYKAGELSRSDVKEVLIRAYKLGHLTREDVKWVIIQAYRAGELSRDDLAWILGKAFRAGELELSDVRWLLFRAYKAGELERSDLVWLIKKAYQSGDFSEADVEEILSGAEDEGVVEEGDFVLEEVAELDEATAEDSASEALEKRLELLKAQKIWVGEKYRIQAEAAVEYLEGEGYETGELSDIVDELTAFLRNVSEAETIEELNEAVDEAHETVSVFRRTLHDVVGNDSAVKEEVREAMQEALEENAEYLRSLWEEYEQLKAGFHKGKILRRFDVFVAELRKQLRRYAKEFNDLGIDTTPLTRFSKLLGERRAELVRILEEGDREDYQAFMRKFSDDVSEGKRKMHLVVTLGKTRDTIARVGLWIRKAEARGLDVTVAKATLAEITSHFRSAVREYEAGHYAEAKRELDYVISNLRQLINSLNRRSEIAAVAVAERAEIARAGVSVSGSGWLEASGNGTVVVDGRGTLNVSTTSATMTVTDESGDVLVNARGNGSKTQVSETVTVYEGYGNATVSGSDMVVSVSGTNIVLRAEGTGSATLSGEGTYSTGKSGTRPQASAWAAEGVTVNVGGD